MTKPAKNTKVDEPEAEASVMTIDEVREAEAVPADAEVSTMITNDAAWSEELGWTEALTYIDAQRRDRVVDAFMAGQPTYGPAPSPFPADPLDLTETVFGDGVYVYPVKLAELQADPVYGNEGALQPADMTAGQYVRIEKGDTYAHTDNTLWVAGKAPL